MTKSETIAHGVALYGANWPHLAIELLVLLIATLGIVIFFLEDLLPHCIVFHIKNAGKLETIGV
jgi:hypothetical protein